MAKKLKVFQTSLGFFDLAIAAPSMKAAAEAWQSNPDIFSRGFAKETTDPKIVKAAMASPGVVLRRPAGSDGAFTERASLPKVQGGRKRTDVSGTSGKSDARDEARRETEEKRTAAERKKTDDARERQKERSDREKREAEAKRKARERKAAEEERERERAEREREHKRRERIVEKADQELERARRRDEEARRSIDGKRKELDRAEARAKEEWEHARKAHADALRDGGS